MAYPVVTARHVNQTAWLVDALLREQGPTETWFTIEGHLPSLVRDAAASTGPDRPAANVREPVNALVWELTTNGHVHVPDPTR